MISETEFAINVHHCHFASYAIQLQVPELGPIFCESDRFFFEHYQEEVDFDRSQTLAIDSKPCDFRFRWKQCAAHGIAPDGAVSCAARIWLFCPCQGGAFFFLKKRNKKTCAGLAKATNQPSALKSFQLASLKQEAFLNVLIPDLLNALPKQALCCYAAIRLDLPSIKHVLKLDLL